MFTSTSLPVDSLSLSTRIDDLSLGGSTRSPASATSARFIDTDQGFKNGGDARWERRKSLPAGPRDPHGSLLRFIQHLLRSEHAESDPHLLAIGYELEALLSIYSSESVKLCLTSRPTSWDPNHAPPLTAYLTPPPTSSSSSPSSASSALGSVSMVQQDWAEGEEEVVIMPGERIRYEVTLPVWEEGEALEGIDGGDMPRDVPRMRVLVSLPPTYPNSSPPQLQLLGRYLGSFSIDAGLFGDITRTYITTSGVPFVPGDVCVFEGLTHVQQLVKKWYATRLSTGVEGEKSRERDRRFGKEGRAMADMTIPGEAISEGETSAALLDTPSEQNINTNTDNDNDPNHLQRPTVRTTYSYTIPNEAGTSEKELSHLTGLEIVHSEPIVDKKSTFIGHAIRVDDERQVPLVIHELLSDRKIAKAAHPAIFAYRIRKDVGGLAGKIYNTDYDDDGETQAGARLKHLLEILDLENVLVVVSRWYGGILLGPDRFKHINQAARDALELGGFLADPESGSGGGGGGKGRKSGKK